MPSLSVGPKLIWFAHCPKAGGTSVEAALVNQSIGKVNFLFWGWDKWFREGGWRTASPPCSPQHLIWDDAIAVLPRRPDAIFAVVRNPIDRLQSEWRWQRERRRGTVIGKALAHLPYVAWVPIMLAMAERYPYTFDNHIRPQSEFVPADAHVFRLEEGLSPVVDWLSETLLTPVSAPEHKLKSGGRKSTNDACKGLISHWYKVDFERFGYESADPAKVALPVWARLASVPLIWLDKRGKL